MPFAPNMDRITRRSVLLGAAGVALRAIAGESGRARLERVGTLPERRAAMLDLSAVDAVARMASGELTAECYARTLLARCKELRALNAFITLDPDHVLEDARASDRRRASGAALGPMHGLPIPIKDSVNTQGYATTAGTPALRMFRPARNAPIVRSLLQAGAIVLGKTNMSELSYGWTSNNLAFGAVHNPYGRSRIPGGSSGGTAVAIASHMAPLGVAEDTEGSIRIPAALCGVAGFRPTTGRYPTRGVVPISPLFDQVGSIARTVADLGLFDAVGSGDHRPLRPLPLRGVKLAVARSYYFSDLEPEVERLTHLGLSKLQDAGAELVEAEVPDLHPLIGLITYQVQNHDIRIQLEKYLHTYDPSVGFADLVAQASANIRREFARSVLPGGPDFVSEQTYRAAVGVYLPRLRQVFREYFKTTTAAAMVFPATRVTAPLIGENRTVQIRGRSVSFDFAISRNIAPGSTAGLPGLVLPVGIASNGLPVALELDGPHGTDRALLGLGLSMEAALGPIVPPPV